MSAAVRSPAGECWGSCLPPRLPGSAARSPRALGFGTVAARWHPRSVLPSHHRIAVHPPPHCPEKRAAHLEQGLSPRLRRGLGCGWTWSTRERPRLDGRRSYVSADIPGPARRADRDAVRLKERVVPTSSNSFLAGASLTVDTRASPASRSHSAGPVAEIGPQTRGRNPISLPGYARDVQLREPLPPMRQSEAVALLLALL